MNVEEKCEWNLPPGVHGVEDIKHNTLLTKIHFPFSLYVHSANGRGDGYGDTYITFKTGAKEFEKENQQPTCTNLIVNEPAMRVHAGSRSI